MNHANPKDAENLLRKVGFLSGRMRLSDFRKGARRSFPNPFQTLPLLTHSLATLRALDHLRAKHKLLVEQFESGKLPELGFTNFARKWGIICVQGTKLPVDFQVLIEFNPVVRRFFLFYRFEHEEKRVEKQLYATMRHLGHFRFAEDLLRKKIVSDTTHLDATPDEVNRAVDWAASHFKRYGSKATSREDFMPELPVRITPYSPPT